MGGFQQTRPYNESRTRLMHESRRVRTLGIGVTKITNTIVVTVVAHIIIITATYCSVFSLVD